MSTRLELCVDLRRESGIAGVGPTATIGQVGEYARVVEWIDAAYEAVQSLHGGRWKFLRTEFSFPTIAATANYTKAAAGLTELGTWKDDTLRCYLTATGVADKQEIEYVPWDEFRYVCGRGSSSTLTGRPRIFSIKPDNSVTFWPMPDAVYTVTGEYFKRPQVMSANDDEPLIPQEFQPIIVWKALMYYGAYTGADEKYSHGQNEYKAVLHKLVRHQLERVSYGAPLA
jgi:hypothetical protein